MLITRGRPDRYNAYIHVQCTAIVGGSGVVVVRKSYLGKAHGFQ